MHEFLKIWRLLYLAPRHDSTSEKTMQIENSRFINTSISAIDCFEDLLTKYYIITYIFHSYAGIGVGILLSFYLTTEFSELLLEVKTIMQLT